MAQGEVICPELCHTSTALKPQWLWNPTAEPTRFDSHLLRSSSVGQKQVLMCLTSSKQCPEGWTVVCDPKIPHFHHGLQLGSCQNSCAMALLEKAFPSCFYSLKIFPLPIKNEFVSLASHLQSSLLELSQRKQNRTKRGQSTAAPSLSPAGTRRNQLSSQEEQRRRMKNIWTAETTTAATQPCSLHSEEQLWDIRLSFNISWDTVERLRFTTEASARRNLWFWRQQFSREINTLRIKVCPVSFGQGHWTPGLAGHMHSPASEAQGMLEGT